MVAGKTYHTVYDDNWYTWYDKNEIPSDITSGGDKVDYIRDNDICPGTNEQYTRANCPPAPDCSKVKQKWGEGKLCINRVPLPFDKTKFYIAAMKCIPEWENCDKCVCGLIDYKTGLCGHFHPGHAPDDDRQQVDCNNLERISYRAVEIGRNIEFDPYEPAETNAPTRTPSASPTVSLSPSLAPTTSPSISSPPSATASSTPSSLPTLVPSYSPSISPSVSPSTLSSTPTLAPSFIVVVPGSQSTIRSTVGIVSMIAGVTLIAVTGIVYYGSRRKSIKQSNEFSPPLDDEETNAEETTFENEDSEC